MTKPMHRLGVELDEIVRVPIDVESVVAAIFSIFRPIFRPHTLPLAIGPRLVSSCPASTFTLQHFFLTACALTASGERQYMRRQLWGWVGRGGLGVSSGGESRPGEWDVSGELRARGGRQGAGGHPSPLQGGALGSPRGAPCRHEVRTPRPALS